MVMMTDMGAEPPVGGEGSCLLLRPAGYMDPVNHDAFRFTVRERLRFLGSVSHGLLAF